ncbi:cell division protein FtsL [Gallaecimonas xiamenensis]|uniref:Cell division protein FtsL n=1 Tax=Gallaecimonas xiamenensis 3-C-1 TaxID=745411 RepID=K2J8C1_9GAMM|nr:cell division protein FtsL [Gallaecimonas xiamenensis]EKE71458.1 cell division protein FtsL [Gallaecimonas xiamenensis 3-C-1]
MADRQPKLVEIILAEVWQSKWLLLLFFAVIASAFAVVFLAQSNRLLTAHKEQLMVERENLDVEWRHLNLEEGALGEHSRVEGIARRELDMKRVSRTDEKVIELK